LHPLVKTWHLQFNDNTPGGWLATLLYGVVILFCWNAFSARKAADRKHAGLSQQFWLSFSSAVTALGINKQLDFQTLLFQAERLIFIRAGMFGYHASFELAVGIMTIVAGAIVAAYLWMIARPADSKERLVIFAVLALHAFALLRFASFNDVPIPLLSRHNTSLPVEIAVLTFLSCAVWLVSNSYRGAHLNS
jgi:hypothetical protein